MFSLLLSYKNESDHMEIQEKKCPDKHTHTHTVQCSHRAPDKVNGNYPEDLARNLQADTNALCCFNKCVFVWTHACVCVCVECVMNMCVLWNVIVHFKMCYTKHILKLRRVHLNKHLTGSLQVRRAF